MLVERSDTVFLIRLWSEPTGGAAEMRGSIVHVPTQECRYFVNYGDLFAFLERWRHAREPGRPESEP